MRRSLVAACALVCLAGCPGADAREPGDGPLRPELNERFLDPDLDLEQWQQRFESESREVYRAREAIVAALSLSGGMRVADVGAGTGLFLPLFAGAVGDAGSVFAVDISPRFLEHLRERVAREGLARVQVVEGTERSVELAADSVDVVFVCDTYHHFTYPRESLASVRHALRRGGLLAIVEFERIPGVSRDWILEHVRADKATFRSEIEAAGFAFEREAPVEGLAENYLLLFRRPPAESGR